MASERPADTAGCRRALEALIGLTRPDLAQDLSDRLIARFGSFGEVISARIEDRAPVFDRLPEIEQTLQSVQLALNHILSDQFARRPVLSSDQAVLDYLRCHMAYEPVERFRELFLNAANELLADEVMGVGTVSAVQTYPREILKRCLELGATALLLAHNHPSGNPAPSKADLDLTHRIANAARWFDVVVHDHLIVARHGWTSFRKAGYL
ncbi:DNA repair protein RadC [Sphingomonas sp. QA11]|uniref:JAB domain-containing protein n=1 Tax=Sphingomonas sp. QA11 TaxID=2950605 RepID=UPI00234AF906|nr:DNA repair protein RadC [Sphingomonas sp. QA11]WCM25922.1 DNA repair protein RadC [Sphingomonas sp. QA11]